MRKPKPNMLKNLKNKSGIILTAEKEIIERCREYFEEFLEQDEIRRDKTEQNND